MIQAGDVLSTAAIQKIEYEVLATKASKLLRVIKW